MQFSLYHALFILIIIYVIFQDNIVESMTNIIPESNQKFVYVYSFSTSPLRISKIKPFIDSLMNQTIPPFKIYANLPYVFKRDNTKFDNLPDFIINNPDIIINWCEDIGPATKIIPSAKLLSKTDPELPIISVDDDTCYSRDHSMAFFEASKKYPNNIIITAGSFIKDNSTQHLLDPSDVNTNKFFAQLLEGYCGVMYRAHMFNDFDTNIMNIIPKFCYLSDDITLSNYVLSKNIPILCIDRRDLITQFEYGFLSDALHKNNESQENKEDANTVNYRNCIRWLKDNNNLHIKYESIPDHLKLNN